MELLGLVVQFFPFNYPHFGLLLPLAFSITHPYSLLRKEVVTVGAFGAF